ncbi:MAG: hypothetical protein IT435_10110 [Phycisphaerales bacterium]|nr:hypothetical protein [Phycisphaerales bacterium]
MTSTQSMFAGRFARRMVVLALTFTGYGMLTACQWSRPARLTPPGALLAPYGTESQTMLWAVTPLRNESGTTLADPLAISDKVVAAVAETRGLRCLPLNRTMETMRALDMTSIRTPADAQALAKAMGADGILVGSITAYEPYQPIFGISLALFGRPGAMSTAGTTELDAKALASKTTETPAAGPSNFAQKPLSVISDHLDGKNHQVLQDVQDYAHGRSDPASSLGWKRYVASMDLYTEFAAHHALGQLIHQEWMRLGLTPPSAAAETK